MSEPASIIVVDDNEIARETLAELLHFDEYKLDFAANGVELLEMLESQTPDVILLDVMMPIMTGYRVCRILKSIPEWKHIPVILITALASREELIKGLESGADEFLVKPVNGAVLRARVRSMLRIKRQYDNLQAMMKVREDLSEMLVHDLRTPVATISAFAELLLRKFPLDETGTGYIDIIREQTSRLDNFINDILLVAKTEREGLLLNRSELDLRELMQEVVENHRPIADSQNISIELEVPDQPLVVTVDRNLVGRVMDNLLSNALKFSPANRSVQLVAELFEEGVPLDEGLPAPTVRLLVKDQGPGIPEAYYEEIFDLYQIVDLRKKGITQIGLGLTFSKMVIEAHGGSISVHSNSPEGAIFEVNL